MAEFQSPSSDVFPPQHQHERSGSMAPDPTATTQPPVSDNGGASIDNASNEKQSTDGDALPPVVPTHASYLPAPATPHVPSPEQKKQVSEVLSSEIGIASLLNRLKQSVAAAKEFALFLKKRSTLEEEHAQGLRKLSRMTQDGMRRPEHRQGTFAIAYEEMMHTHDRMAENGTQFAASLHQMHDELMEVSTTAERARKSWKQNGLSAEQKVADMEQAMRKSKAKYDSLAEDYERARMGEARQSGKMFGALKGHKSAAQHEEDLLKKVQAADQIYYGHVQTLQGEKATLVTTTRPDAVKQLQDLIREADSAVTMQMSKFAAFNEKLLLSNGLSISPISGPGAEVNPQQKSLRQAVSEIDNEKDLNDYIISQHKNMQPKTGEIKYERNPALGPQGGSSSFSQPTSGPLQQQPAMNPPQTQNQPPQPMGPGSRTSTLGLGPMTGSQGPPGMDPGFSQSAPGDQPRPFSQQHARSYSQGNMQGPPGGQQPQHGPRYGNGAGGSISSSGPPQLGALPFQGSQPPASQQPPSQAAPPFQTSHERSSSVAGPGQSAPPAAAPAPVPAATAGPSSQRPSNHPLGRSPPAFGMQQPQSSGPSAPSKPVFGLPLNKLYERDGLAVPMVVYQCIQAVDLFGLGVEGIYRQSGSMNHIQRLKSMFDTDSANPLLDFRNPENFYHDVNSVTGLLKQFFRDLPDPLLTVEHHDSFIAAAKHDEDVVRRDSLHAIINSLPDPNYATLRALTLHLYRVMDQSHTNRMNSHNLAVIFGPTLMGTDPSTAIADAGWQIKVIDTILQNTYQIFDED